MEAEASRLIRSLREEQDVEGVRAFLGAVDDETVSDRDVENR